MGGARGGREKEGGGTLPAVFFNDLLLRHTAKSRGQHTVIRKRRHLCLTIWPHPIRGLAGRIQAADIAPIRRGADGGLYFPSALFASHGNTSPYTYRRVAVH
jgi:hypothetical protein